jgi:mRNA interferase RelE/StbE
VYPYLVLIPRYGPNIKRFRDYVPPTWRYRIGDWRFFYTIDDEAEIVSMLVAEHRGRVCRRR